MALAKGCEMLLPEFRVDSIKFSGSRLTRPAPISERDFAWSLTSDQSPHILLTLLLPKGDQGPNITGIMCGP